MSDDTQTTSTARMLARISASVAVMAAALVGPVQPAHAGAADPTRILIVGDSVTSGSVGDWTWRYRLWNNLTSSGADVDFVGPNQGVSEGDTINATGYADPNFDTDHAARWGMSFALPDHPVEEMVAEYDADVVVEDLGFNDLTWLQGAPEVVADLARRFVADVRASNPAASVVLCELPQAWFAKTAEYNALLEELATELDTPDARVVVAQAPAPFVLDEDTYDPAHPSATGEVKIARSVAEALAGVGVGSDPEAFPEVVNGPATAPVLSTARTRFGLPRLSWTMPLGASGVEMWRRQPGGQWRQVAPRSMLGLRPGQVVDVRVQAFKGSSVSPLLSNVVTVARGSR